MKKIEEIYKKHYQLINLILFFLMIAWTAFVLYNWFLSHSSVLISILYPYGLYSTITALQPILVPALITILFFIYIFFIKKTSILRINYSWLGIALLFLFLITILFNIAAFSRVTFPELENFLDIARWPQYNAIFLKKSLSLIIWILLFSLSLYLMGTRVYRYFKKSSTLEDNAAAKNLSIFSIGIVTLSIILFILGYFHLLYKETLIILFSILITLEFKKFIKIIKGFFSLRPATINLKSASLIFIWLSIFILSSSFIDSLRQMPLGFDASTEYLNRAKLIANQGTLTPGYFPFAYSLISSIGYLFSESASFSIGTNLLYFIVAYFSIYCFTVAIIKNKNLGIISATIWASMPMTNEFLLKDAKVELLLFLTSSISLILFYLWLNNKKDNTLLYISMLLLGMSFSVKITALFLIIPIFTYYSFVLFKSPKKLKEKIVATLLAVLFFIAPITPWLELSLQTHNYGETENYLDMFKSYTKDALNLTENDFLKIGVDKKNCQFTGYAEDIKKFKSNKKPLISKALLPWEISINRKNTRKPMTEIGFLYLIFIPLFLLYLIKRIHIKERGVRISFLAMTAIAYWILWAFMGKGMIWYGFPGFLLICMFIAITLNDLKNHKITKNILLILILFMTIIFASLQAARFANIFILQNIGNNIDFRKETFSPIIESIREDGFILSTASQSIYYIENNNKRVVKDHYLDLFNCIDYAKNDRETLSNLNKLGIKYILYNDGISHLKEGTRAKKVDRFKSFAKNNLKLEKTQMDHTLFSVPK